MNIEVIRNNTLKAIAPLRTVDTNYYGGTRTRSGNGLPEYYMVYFLLVDLLGFKCLGKGEKIAWSIPVDLEGQLFHIEYRKLGLGVFSSGALTHEASEVAAEDIVRLVHQGVRVARPYFDSCAEKAVKESKVSIRNKSTALFDRFQFLLGEYKRKLDEAEPKGREPEGPGDGSGGLRIRFPDYRLQLEGRWLALSAIESFFSWTEHVFILLAILQEKCVTGESVNNLARSDWKTKFRMALDIDDPELKRYYDYLTAIRDEIRNFVAHGSFGKKGEAFLFHSPVGAVPVVLPHREGRHSYSFLGDGPGLPESEAIRYIEHFIECIKSGHLAPAWIYLDSDLDLVLTKAKYGDYELAMESMDSMKEFVEMETYIADAYADMDWFLLP